MLLKPWKILESKYIQPHFRVDKCELPNGKLLNATVMEFRSWGNVLAITKDQKVVLVKQYRHGVEEVLLELPGGVIEDNEEPLVGVKRELLEETGYTTDKFIDIGSFYPNPANQTNSLYCFLALDVEKVEEQNLDDGEEIEVHLIPLDKVIEMVKNNQFLHGLQVATLLKALLYLNRVS